MVVSRGGLARSPRSLSFSSLPSPNFKAEAFNIRADTRANTRIGVAGAGRTFDRER